MLLEPLDAGRLDQPDDAALALQAQSGDARALAALLQRHDGVLRRTILRRTQHPADVDDVLQETTLKVWQHLPSLREPAKARAWILQIAAREALRSATARRQEHELTEEAASVDGPDLLIDRFDLQDGLRTALRAMPEQQARAWIMREIHGLSYRQIAQDLAIPESSVRGSLVLARRRAQEAIDACCPSARPNSAAARRSAGARVASAPLRGADVAQPMGQPPRSSTTAALQSSIHEDFEIAGSDDPPRDARRPATARSSRIGSWLAATGETEQVAAEPRT